MCPVQCMPQKGRMKVVPNERNELVPILTLTRWRVCMDYQKLNVWAEKDNFPILFVDQLFETLVGEGWYYIIDGYLG